LSSDWFEAQTLEFLGLNRDNFSQKWRVGVFFGTLEKNDFSNKLLEKAVWVNFTLDRICRLLLKILENFLIKKNPSNKR
jgi:hypothetical protein